MKFFMAFLFSIVPAAMVAVLLAYFVGPWALPLGWAIFGLGLDVCLNGSDS